LSLGLLASSIESSYGSFAAPTGDTLYVFAYSWQPEFCYNQNTWPGCLAPEDYWRSSFTIHGLWPQYVAGGYPADCTTEPLDESTFKAIGMETMTKYWPNVQVAEYDADGNINPNYYSFWEHEWSKHGTCSGLTQIDYFNNTIRLTESFVTPPSVQNSIGGAPVDASKIRSEFGGSNFASLQCTAGSYLVGVYTCWERDSNGHPTVQVACPADVVAEDTCTSASVSVVAFQQF